MNTAEDFKFYLEKLSTLAKRNKLPHRYDGGTGCFDQLSEKQRVLAITGLRRETEFLHDFEATEADIGNSAHLLNYALKSLHLHLPAGVQDRVQPDDFVEIYSTDLIAIFKSPNFWAVSSNTLDEIYTYPFHQLYGRSEFHQAAIQRTIEKLLSGTCPVMENPIPAHETWELRGIYRAWIEFKFASTVYEADASIAGLMSVTKLTLLNPPSRF